MRRDVLRAAHTPALESLERTLYAEVQAAAMQLGIDLHAPEGERYNKRDVLAYCVAQMQYTVLPVHLRDDDTRALVHRAMAQYREARLHGQKLIHVHGVMRGHLEDVGLMLEEAGYAAIRAPGGFNRPLLCFIALMLEGRKRGLT
jgi:hypothetical protein